MMCLQKNIPILICFVSLLFWNCSFEVGKSSAMELLPGWSQQRVEFILPSYPVETHPNLVGWKVEYVQGGQIQSDHLAATEKSIILNMDKNRPTPVLCYPLTKIQGRTVSFFRPAGCVYPYKHQATWLDGFAAEIFFQLAKSKSPKELATSPLLRFNWPRLSQQVAKRIENATEKGRVFSPWFLQEDVLKDAILQGSASTRSIKQESLEEFSLEEHSFSKDFKAPLDNSPSFSSPAEIYYRYIPAGKVQNQIGANLIFPQYLGYAIHQENAFLMGEKILSVFTKKNQKPVLATMGIERYTEGNETF